MSREMKQSGVPWIGEIPKTWEIRKVKDVFVRKNEKAHQDNPVILSLARAGVKVRDVSTNEGQMAESYYDYNPVEPFDLLVNPMDLYSGANCSMSLVSGVISPAYVNLRAKGGACSRFYDYYFKTQYWSMAFFAHGKGISFDNRWTLGVDTLFRYNVPFPSVLEQQKIASFLDRKCSEIDEMIALQEKIVDELKAYKQSVITEAVTKGLNFDVPMKDSGIEWIGEIPEHWEICRFKNIAKVKANLVHPDDYLDYPQIAPDNIEKGSGRLISSKTVRESNIISDNHLFFKGQIIYSKIRPVLNKLTIAPFDGLCSADMYPIETIHDVGYMKYFMLSDAFVSQVAIVVQDRVKMPKINQDELGVIHALYLPHIEQNRIADYLDSKCVEIDDLISIKLSKIDSLKEYKKSIIYEYVTGKKEVTL